MAQNQRDTREDSSPREPQPPAVVPAGITGMYGSVGAPMDGPPPLIYGEGIPVNAASLKLQELIDVNIDSSRACEEAAEIVTEQHLIDLFRRIARERRAQAEELARYVGDRGEHPDAGGTVASTLHRAWVRLKAAVSDNDERMILDETEAAEDHVKERYEDAMGTRLPEEAQKIVARHQQAVLVSHAKVRELRDRYRAES